MLLLLLTLFFIAGKLGVHCRNFKKPSHTINASLFPGLFIVIYSPQLSSLLLSSLNLDKLLITAISITFLFVVCFTKFFTKHSAYVPPINHPSKIFLKAINLPPVPHPHSCKHLRNFQPLFKAFVRLWI